MIIKRTENWGFLQYKIPDHDIEAVVNNNNCNETPYTNRPILLNIDLTFKCNMNCVHCVAQDMATLLGGADRADLVCNESLISAVNNSDFMIIVITGGEPLLPNYETNLIWLMSKLKNKAIIIDTNATICPSKESIDIIKEKRALVRISWDSPNTEEECTLRKFSSKLFSSEKQYIDTKIKVLNTLISYNIPVAVQTVLHKKNINNRSLYEFPKKLKQLNINKWYIQRLIPSYKIKNNDEKNKYIISYSKYNEKVKKLVKECKKAGVTCISKREKRHNSVFLLVKEGDLYTQSDKIDGKKIYLGKLDQISNNNFFNYVSSADHSVRYYNGK